MTGPASAMDLAQLTDAQRRSILLEYRFGIDNRNITQLCTKYALEKATFQKLRTELAQLIASREDLVIAGVYEGATTIENLIGYLDYRDHARYTEAEVQVSLDKLVALGVLVGIGGTWQFAPDAPAADNRFIFTAPERAQR